MPDSIVPGSQPDQDAVTPRSVQVVQIKQRAILVRRKAGSEIPAPSSAVEETVQKRSIFQQQLASCCRAQLREFSSQNPERFFVVNDGRPNSLSPSGTP
jgi:hypothetical protein